MRALSRLAVSAQALSIAGWIVGWALEPNYSPVRDYVSELGRRGAANPWIFDVSIVLWGAGFIALALAMLTALRTRPWAHVAPALFVLAGVCAILDAPLRLAALRRNRGWARPRCVTADQRRALTFIVM